MKETKLIATINRLIKMIVETVENMEHILFAGFMHWVLDKYSGEFYTSL